MHSPDALPAVEPRTSMLEEAVSPIAAGAARAALMFVSAVTSIILAGTVWHIASHSITGAELQAFIAPTSLDTQSRSIEQLIEGAR